MNLWEFDFINEDEEETSYVIAHTLYEALEYFYSHNPDTMPSRITYLGSPITGEKTE